MGQFDRRVRVREVVVGDRGATGDAVEGVDGCTSCENDLVLFPPSVRRIASGGAAVVRGTQWLLIDEALALLLR